MFGDGMESEYIWDGMSIKGLNNMTDAELLDDLEQYSGEDGDEGDGPGGIDNLYGVAKKEMNGGSRAAKKQRSPGGKRRAVPATSRLKRIKQLSRGR